MRRLIVVTALAVAFVIGGVAAQAGDRARPELRAIADAYADDGDLDAALGALKKANATAGELLRTLRTPLRPSDEPVPGVHSIEIKDGDGTTTDLLIAAPTAEQIKAHAEKGLGLVVLLHGLGGSSRQARPIAEKLAATGEVVAVAPSAQKLSAKETTDDDGIPDLFKNRHWWGYESPRSFPLEAIRKARSLYPIDPDRVVLSGMSMGGYGTWNIGLRWPDHFAGLAPLAGGISRYRVDSDKDEVSRALLENGRLTPLLSIHGTADPIVPYNCDKEACEHLKSLGGQVELRSLDGVDHGLLGIQSGRTEHGEYLVKWLTERHRNAAPEGVTYADVGDRLDGAYWLRWVTKSASVKYPQLTGKIDKAKNRVTVDASGVERARIYIDDRLLDLSKPVAIRIGNTTRIKRKVEPDLRAILESWRSRRDEQLVYPAFIEIDPRDVQ